LRPLSRGKPRGIKPDFRIKVKTTATQLPPPLLSGAGTQKNSGACPQKAAPEQVRVSFCGHPAPLFFCECGCQNPGGVGFGTICILFWSKLSE
ncbi:MAG: hypothetical protein LBP29_07175, partial [Treponema sp.]|nr:hypothetical protein [Treponema sp.]